MGGIFGFWESFFFYVGSGPIGLGGFEERSEMREVIGIATCREMIIFERYYLRGNICRAGSLSSICLFIHCGCVLPSFFVGLIFFRETCVDHVARPFISFTWRQSHLLWATMIR